MKTLAAATIALAASVAIAQADTLSLGSLDVKAIHQGFGRPVANQSIGHHPLTINGQVFKNGIGTHAESEWTLHLGGQSHRFTAKVGVDDEEANPKSSVRFFVIGDAKVLWKSDVIRAKEAAVDCSVDLTGVQDLTLYVSDAGDGNMFDHADWADAQIEYTGEAPKSATLPVESAEILTPKPAATPRITGAAVFGVRPGSPILYTVSATGDKPMKFAASGLPEGASFDATTGQLSGSVKQPGTYDITLTATNDKGSATRAFKLVVGNTIALTPPMGWNSWNCFAGAVTEDRVKSAADAMVSSGLVDHGWTYINVDDFWQVHRDSKDPTLQGPQRDPNGVILPNPRFPDMKGLADYIHAKGLKAGLYSSPGLWTCGGCVGSYQHEAQDAQTYAQWGFDYLKYDWCSYGSVADKIRHSPNPPTALQIQQAPYQLMGDELAKQPRDILFSLCQYGMGDVWNWGKSVGGNCWRTTGDINDSWSSMSGIGFRQGDHAKNAGPGGWNDPDMLVVGQVGWGRTHPSHLTPNEQYTHISLWCLEAAPLLIGCDMTKLDDFTLNLLTNDEVLAIDQDPLGKAAAPIDRTEFTQVWARDLADGSKAVGLFNLGPMASEVTLDLSKLGVSGKQVLRDLWRQKDVTTTDAPYTTTLPRHGVLLLKVSPAK